MALAAILSGCLVFKAPPTAKQIKDKPKVAVKFTICESDGEGKTDCPRLGNDGGFDPADGSSGRVLFGLRVPKGTKVAKQFPQRSGDLLATSEFVRDASYKRSLNQTAPKGDKYRYFGYISDETNEWKGDDDETGLEGEFKVKMKVPKDLVGKKFKVRPVVGGTVLDPGEIDCGPIRSPITTPATMTSTI